MGAGNEVEGMHREFMGGNVLVNVHGEDRMKWFRYIIMGV